MKNDKLQKLKILKRIILFTLALTLTNCQVDDDVTEQPQSAIKTVNIDEAKTFLKQSLNNTSAKLLGSETVNLKLDKITQEKINGSDQLLTVIPVLTNDKKEYSRILISRIGGVLRAVVFSMYSDKDSITEKFSGKIMIRNLNGNFLNGYRVENGIYVSQFQKTTKNITKREGGEETPSSGEIPLNEVVITNSYRRPNAATPWLYLYHDLDDSGGGFGNYSWDSGNGGGGGEGTSPPTTDDADPCDELKKQNANPNFKAKVDVLKTKTTELNEAGFAQKKDGTFHDLIKTTVTNELNLPPGEDYVGSVHTHQDPYPSGKLKADGSPVMLKPIPIFSPKDVVQFLEFLNNTKTNKIPQEDIYSMMVSSSRTYELKFTGNITDVKVNFDWKVLESAYITSIKENGLEEGFLKFLEANIGIKGITLYKINNDGTSENKSLDSNSNMQTNPCQ